MLVINWCYVAVSRCCRIHLSLEMILLLIERINISSLENIMTNKCDVFVDAQLETPSTHLYTLGPRHHYIGIHEAS